MNGAAAPEPDIPAPDTDTSPGSDTSAPNTDISPNDRTVSSDALSALDDALPLGAYVRARGTLRAFSSATNPGEFNSLRYYRILRCAFRLQNASVLSVSATSDPLASLLYLCKRRLGVVLDSCLPAREASVMKAMLLGEKGLLDPSTKELYQENGIIHILAISGLHVSLLGMGLYRLLRRLRLPLPPSAALCILLILLYGKMTGLGPSSFRAVFMFLLHMMALLLGRTYDLLTAASLAGVLLLADQPLYLWHSGFLFSFGAVLAIGLLLPVLPGKTGVVLAVPLANLPVYLSFYHTFPLYSLLLNLAVLPLMSLVMILGLAVLALGSLSVRLGALAGWGVRAILALYQFLCLLASSLPGHTLIPGAPPPWTIALFLLFLAVLIFLERHFPPVIRMLWLAAAVMLLCLRPADGLRITFLDVGQGDGIYIESEGIRILVDGGSSSKSALAEYQLTPFLTYSGVSRIDLAILSHDDTDHCSGLLSLLEEGEISIGALALPAIAPDCVGGNYRALENLAQQKNIPVSYVSRGDVLQSGPLTLAFLHPQAQADYADVNACSATFLLTYGNFSALFTGDLEQEGEAELMRYLHSEEGLAFLAALPSSSSAAFSPTVSSKTAAAKNGGQELSFPLTVLKAAHHGSKYASGEDFLSLFPPRYAILSAGRGNRYGHPAPETLERLHAAGAQTLTTIDCGAITISTDGKSMRIGTYLTVPDFSAAE
ncbi:MAG: DNA internalization-related competence protein ComEC/Rec2 [Eubacteriales bacterium]|nr:DNA internalization-related competence protein ComEC/Rec2 [Eubacteriales bacterium]